MKKVLIILTVMLLLAFTLTFFACNKEPVFAPNGICVSENFIFFPEERNDLHNAELREAFDKYCEGNKQPFWFDKDSNYELYNHIDRKTSKKYGLDIFEVCQKSYTIFFLKYKDNVVSLCGGNTNRYKYYLTNFAITDIDNDGHIEILTSVSYNVVDGFYDNQSRVHIYDSKTNTGLHLANFDFPTFFKEDEHGVVTIYNIIHQPRSFEDIENSIYNSSFFYNEDLHEYGDYAVFESPMLNTTKFNFKETSFSASCDLFSVEATVDFGTIAFPYNLKTGDRIFKISANITYLGEPFVHIEHDTTLNIFNISFVNETISYSIPSIMSGWFAMTEFSIETGKKIYDFFRFFETANYTLPAGVYDIVITFQSPDAPVCDQIVLEDFLTVTR